MGKLRLIQLSRIFMHSSDFLVLDQPTKGLDPEHKISFWDALSTVLKDRTFIYSSQDFDEIENHSNRVAFLSEGKIRLNGTISEIIDKTKAYGCYKILFKDKIDELFVKKMQENDDLYHLKIESDRIEFYTPRKDIFFDIFQESVKYGILDVEINPFKLKDVFLTQVKKNNE